MSDQNGNPDKWLPVVLMALVGLVLFTRVKGLFIELGATS
jgi:hypothetical protein